MTPTQRDFVHRLYGHVTAGGTVDHEDALELLFIVGDQEARLRVRRDKTGLDYDEYLASDEWAAKRAAALNHAGHCCHLCPSSRHLEVHHRTYRRLGWERPEDLIVLCRRCHRRQHLIAA